MNPNCCFLTGSFYGHKTKTPEDTRHLDKNVVVTYLNERFLLNYLEAETEIRREPLLLNCDFYYGRIIMTKKNLI